MPENWVNWLLFINEVIHVIVGQICPYWIMLSGGKYEPNLINKGNASEKKGSYTTLISIIKVEQKR